MNVCVCVGGGSPVGERKGGGVEASCGHREQAGVKCSPCPPAATAGALQSDIWSLGCVLYELAVGKHAFDAPNMRALIQKVSRLLANRSRGRHPPACVLVMAWGNGVKKLCEGV